MYRSNLSFWNPFLLKKSLHHKGGEQIMEDIFPILKAIETNKGMKVLATIVNVEGSAYKKEGSCMLFLEDGSQIGLLSGGCLEEDLRAYVERIFQKKESLLLNYNLRDEMDNPFGMGIGCIGRITVLLEPVSERLEKDLLALKKLFDNGHHVIVLKQLSSNYTNPPYIFLSEKEERLGTWEGDRTRPYHQLIEELSVFGGKPGLYTLKDFQEPVFAHVISPQPKLVIFGAGLDAKPLVSLAANVGFSVILLDWRPAFCNNAIFPEASNCIVASPSEFSEKIHLTSSDCVIIMSHHFQKDKEFLNHILQKKINYLGILGSRKRTRTFFEDEEIPKWVHSPIGLPIGAKGSEEIAVSIVAELIKQTREVV
jgi:xanthine dehydrogenase accessory factor